MKDIPTIRGRHYIAELVAEGEHLKQDFKFTISDAHKIAHSISAFANAEGGHLLIGVKDNGTIAGVRNEEDIYVVEQAATLYCKPAIDVEFTAFRVDPTSVVIRAYIPKAENRPVKCKESDGTWYAYYRVADENIIAHPLMIKSWQTRNPVNLCLNATTQALLEYVESQPDGCDTTDIAVALGISSRSVENIVVDMVSAGILGFEYHAPKFKIKRL